MPQLYIEIAKKIPDSAMAISNSQLKKIIEMTQKKLTGTKDVVKDIAKQMVEAKTGKSASNLEALYQRIEQTMTKQKLYLNPNLDIQLLAEHICSSRTLVSVCINSITGKTFRQWLSEYRLGMFTRTLQSTPNEHIDELIHKCGYKDQSTFRRQFKATYGMTAGKYRKTLTK